MIAQSTTQSNNRKPSELDRLLRTRSYRWSIARYRRVCFYRKVTAQLMDACHERGTYQAAADLVPIHERLCDIEQKMRHNFTQEHVRKVA